MTDQRTIRTPLSPTVESSNIPSESAGDPVIRGSAFILTMIHSHHKHAIDHGRADRVQYFRIKRRLGNEILEL